MDPAAPVSEGGEAAGAFLEPGVWNLLDDGPGDQSPEAPAYVDDLRLSEVSDPPFGWDDPYGSAEERDWYSQVQDNDLGSFECVDDEQSKVLVPSAPSSSVSGEVSWLQGRPAEEDAAQQVQAAENKRRRLSLAKQPWDSTPSHLSRSFNFFFEGMPSVGVRESLTLTHEEDPAPGFDQIPWTVTRRLAKARIPKSDADIRDSALKRLKMLILLDPEATSLGCSLVEQGKALSPDEDIMQSLSDAFRPKASLTLQKRSLSLQVYVVRSYEASLASPWRLSEEQMYQVIASFRREGAKASTASHILEALRFFDAIVRFKYINLEEVLSSRVRGVAQDLRLRKAPLRQRDSLTHRRVEALELHMESCSEWARCVVGQFLFCIHSSCRWTDSQNVISLDLTAEGEGQLLIAEALGSKTSITVEAKTRLLPYVCVASGVSDTPWAQLWMQAREKEGITFDRGCLPSWSHKWGCWGQERMSSEEAADYLYEILTSLGLAPGPGESIGTHSFKATLITWSGWCSTPSFTPLERQLMGHHVRREGSTSTLIYSRQYYVNLAGKILAMFQAIRQGSFNPDAGITERVSAVAAAQSVGPSTGSQEVRRGSEAQAGGADVASSESAESVVDYEPMPGMGSSFRPPFECTVAELRVHTLSGIVHRLRDATTFFCGRPATGRYRDFEEDDAEDPDTCHQCRRAMSTAD